jgi:hypothetical protein
MVSVGEENNKSSKGEMKKIMSGLLKALNPQTFTECAP